MPLRDQPRFDFQIRDAINGWHKEIFLVERTENETFLVNIAGVDERGYVTLKRTKVESNYAINAPPFLTLSYDIAPGFLEALKRALDADRTIPNPSEDQLRGKLEAIKEHLGDMRRLVFDPKGGPNAS